MLSILPKKLTFSLKLSIALVLLPVTITSICCYFSYSTSYNIALSLLQKNLQDVLNTTITRFTDEDIEALKRIKKNALDIASLDRKKLHELSNGEVFQSIPQDIADKIHKSDDYLKVQKALLTTSYATLNDPFFTKDQKLGIDLFKKGGAGGYIMIELPKELQNEIKNYGMYLIAECPDPVDKEWQGNPIGNVFKAYFSFDKLSSGCFVADKVYNDSFYNFLGTTRPILDKNGQVVAILGFDYGEGSQLDKLKSLRNLCLILIFASLLSSLVFARFIVKSLTSPLQTLCEAANKIGENNYNTRVKITGKDEFSFLGTTFNKMAENIQIAFAKLDNYNKKLEQTVAERTAELKTANDELEQLFYNQEDFYQRAAHEIRTSLNLIQVPLESTLTQAHDEKLEIALKGAKRLTRLVDEMLHANQQGLIRQIGIQSIDSTSFFQAIFDNYAYLAKEKNIDFFIGGLPQAAISCNKSALESIIHNLLDNAIKYTPENETIKVFASLSNAMFCFRVQDTGLGIEKKAQEKIFKRGYRVDSIKNTTQGYGLGLYSIQNRLNELGGSIKLISELGQGSEFIVYLPCSYTENNIENTQEYSSTKSEEKILDSSADETILIIEDDRETQKTYKTLLQDQYSLIFAGNIKEGISKAQEKSPSLILCDLMLPDGSGFKVIKNIKEDEETSYIPLIVVTAVGDFSGQKSGLELGADDYIIKPFYANDLLMRIASTLSNRKKLREYYSNKLTNTFPRIKEQTNLKYKLKLNPEDLDLIEELEDAIDFFIKEEVIPTKEKVAEKMNITAATLQKTVKSLTDDKSFTFIRDKKRIPYACSLLEQDYTPTEVADKLGYANLSGFTRWFSKKTKLTPTEYQENSSQ